MKEGVIGFVAVVAVSSLMMLGASWLADMGCEARWRDSGINSDYTLISGCRVQRTDGTWIPDSAIRNLE